MAELVIFDCDGVLVDSERISNGVLAKHLTELGLPTTIEEAMRDYMGRTGPANLDLISERLGRRVPQSWVDDWEKAVRQAFVDELKPVQGVVEALDAIEVPTCVASSGTHEKMRLTLGLTGLANRFAGRIFSGEEVEHGKPAPDLFLYAAKRMGTAPDQCVVVEDSRSGVAAAKAAGMRVLGFTAATAPDGLADADVVFSEMRELPKLLAG